MINYCEWCVKLANQIKKPRMENNANYERILKFYKDYCDRCALDLENKVRATKDTSKANRLAKLAVNARAHANAAQILLGKRPTSIPKRDYSSLPTPPKGIVDESCVYCRRACEAINPLFIALKILTDNPTPNNIYTIRHTLGLYLGSLERINGHCKECLRVSSLSAQAWSNHRILQQKLEATIGLLKFCKDQLYEGKVVKECHRLKNYLASVKGPCPSLYYKN